MTEKKDDQSKDATTSDKKVKADIPAKKQERATEDAQKKAAMQAPEENKTDHKETAAENAPPMDQDKKKKKNQTVIRILISALITVAALIVIGIIVIGVGIYAFSWQSNVTKQVSSVIPYPAAMYDANIISFHEYQSDLDTLQYFYNVQEQENPGEVQRPTESFLEKSILSRMVREEFLMDKASEFNLTISQETIDSEYEALAATAGGTGELEQVLDNIYQWTPAQFKEKVIKPYVIRSEVQEYLAADDSVNTEALASIEEVADALAAGDQTFEELAQQYSEDVTASEGGDLGYFGRGQMVEEFENAVFDLEEGEVSGIVQTQFGYHIIKLTERVAATEEQEEQLRASHILVKTKNVDEWTTEQLAESTVYVLMGDYEWKDDCGLVLATSETCDDNELVNTNATVPLNAQ